MDCSQTPIPYASRPGILDGKAEYVRWLFSAVPNDYDQLLGQLTLRQDRRWRARAIRAAQVVSTGSVLDLATGTGIFAKDWRRAKGKELDITALDLTLDMLRHAHRALENDGSIPCICGRTESLPFADSRFDAVSVGLALRNLTSLEASFSEIQRVLRPGGRLVSIDFTRPPNPLLRRAYYVYLCKGLPAVGRSLSPEWSETFEYLWRSILRFRPVEEVVSALRGAGFVQVQATLLTGGIAALLTGTRP